MRRGAIILIFIICMSSFISAEVIFTQELKPVYNLGDIIHIPVTVKTTKDTSTLFQMDLICNETAINFYKNGINLVSGAEKTFDSSLVLTGEVIGSARGICKIKAMVGEGYVLSNEFKISDFLIVTGNLEKKEFDSGGNIFMSGKVTRETGENSDGFIEAIFISNDANQNIEQIRTVNSGSYLMNFSLPFDLKAGNYVLRLKAYEKDSDGLVTNTGFRDYNILIRQIPTNLEIAIENKLVTPGTPVRIKTILHDQTGEPIISAGFITIKDQYDKILEQDEIITSEYFEYQIMENEPPAKLKVFAVSNKLTAEEEFQIKVNEKVDIQIVNKTILVTNVGNVPYSKMLLVDVGGSNLNIPVNLEVGKSKKYILSAPGGEYKVDIKSETGEEISGVMSLTGGAVGAREVTNGHYTVLAWILMILILGFIAFTIFRKIYKKPFSGKMISKKKGKKEKPMIRETSIIGKTTSEAELSLSIKGEKQEASVICIKLKNLKEMKSGKGSASETIQKAMDLAEENKGVHYENQDYLFFIFAPTKTRTFKNERTALEIADKIQNLLTRHNKTFNQKVEFGISLEHGTIVAKVENGIFKFMAMGTLMTSAKRVASLSRGEVLLGEKMNDLLRMNIRTEKHVREGVSVFSVKEVKRENEEARKFIDSFMKRMEKK